MRAALLLLAAGLSCGPTLPKRVDFSETRRNYQPQDYPQVLRAWTRHSKVIRDVGTVIEAWATYKSWDFRQAYIERFARVYDRNDEDRRALYNSELVGVRKGYEFHVVVQTTKYTWNNLEKENTAWRVSLVDGTGAELTPSSIKVEKLPDLYETEFFPYRTEFSRTYTIRFEPEEGFLGPKSGRIILRIASPLGKAELVWESM